MRRGRRGILRAAAGILGGTLTGRAWTGRADGERPRPVPPSDGHSRTGAGRDAESSEAQQPTGQEPGSDSQQPSVNPELERRARRVLNEIDWFATRYPAAIQTYQAALRRGAARVRELRTESSVSPEQAKDLQATFDGVVETIRTALSPHFGIHHGVRDRSETHTGTILRFARRNDTDRVMEELGRLEGFAVRYASDVFVRETMPRVPILNRLIDFLRAGPFRERSPLLFRVYHGSTGFRSYVYREQSFGRYELYRPGYDNRILARFDPQFLAVDAPAGRTERYYLSVFAGDGQTPDAFGTAPSPDGTQVIYVQRYPDASRAAQNAARVLDRDGVFLDQFREESYPLGDSDWDRLFYQHEGDTLYTLFTRAGPFLFATAPSRVAWEERVGAHRLLKRTFLAGE